MKKSALRKQANSLRKEISPEQLKALSKQLLLQFGKLNLQNVQVLHIFLPIVEKNEPDTFLIVEWLKNHHPEIKILVPKSDFNTLMMSHHEIGDQKELQKNAHNILEPQQQKEHQGPIDMVLIPLLAFDKRGYRVGYGKGFYDRFLQDINTIKVGVSLFEVSEDIEDLNRQDLKMDYCITPGELYDFRSPEV